MTQLQTNCYAAERIFPGMNGHVASYKTDCDGIELIIELAFPRALENQVRRLCNDTIFQSSAYRGRKGHVMTIGKKTRMYWQYNMPTNMDKLFTETLAELQLIICNAKIASLQDRANTLYNTVSADNYREVEQLEF